MTGVCAQSRSVVEECGRRGSRELAVQGTEPHAGEREGCPLVVLPLSGRGGGVRSEAERV